MSIEGPIKATLPKCGNCKYAYVMPEDLKKRVCKGGPPQVVLLPIPGGAQVQYHYPVVGTDADPCAFHRFKMIDGEITNL